jgi:predicted HicB family RNase H-like nuclease
MGLFVTSLGDDMPKPRKDKPPIAKGEKFTIYAPIPLVHALNRMADAKGISRNALIVQALSKLAKKHIEEQA